MSEEDEREIREGDKRGEMYLCVSVRLIVCIIRLRGITPFYGATDQPAKRSST